MKRFAVLAAAAALVTLTPATAGALRADPVHRLRAGLATNWAGYVAHGGPFTRASTSWTEPSISCASNERSALASFAGLDGAGSSTVEQIGTLSNCKNGSVVHQAFYEMFPRGAFAISRPVRAGDSLTATVVATSSRKFTLSLANHTEGWSFSTQQRSRNARLASAEAITEAPSMRGSGVVALSNFGQINYSGTTASPAFSNPEAVTMVTGNGTVKASPTSLSGGSFSVVWHHA